jgi:hypothetical protein
VELARRRAGVPRERVKMAKRIENECAFCAEEIIEGEEVVGKDWKVYCSELCAEAGERISIEEWRKVMGGEELGVGNGEWGVGNGKSVSESAL